MIGIMVLIRRRVNPGAADWPNRDGSAVLWADLPSTRMMNQGEHCRFFSGKTMSSGLLVQNTTNGTLPTPPVIAIPVPHHHRLKPLGGKPAGTLLIHEIYRSLQGESTFA